MARFLTLLILNWIFLFTNKLQIKATRGVRLPMDRDRYDFEFVYNYTKYLHGVYRFNSFITFSHYEARRRPNFIMSSSFEQALLEDFNVPIIVCGRHSPSKLRHLIGLNNLVIVQFNTFNDSILEAVDRNLEGLHFITILFFYKHKHNKPPTALEIRNFFGWCWFRNMINVALTFQVIEVTKRSKKRSIFNNRPKVYIQNQVYTYTPFPILTVQNRTAEVANGKGEYTADRVTNVNGYIFRAQILQHPPYVFLDSFDARCCGRKYCAHSLTGIAGQIYKEYISQINGTIKLELVPSSSNYEDFNKVLLAAAKKRADIVPHPFSELLMSNELSAGSYPIAQTNVCIIVPLQQQIQREHYLPCAFQQHIWCYMLFTFFLLFFMEICFNVKNSKVGIQWLSLAFITAINLFLNLPPKHPSNPAASKFRKVFHIIIPSMTFVITNMYAASLTSLLTAAPYGEQIDTVAQLLAANLEIMATSTDRDLFFKKNHLPAELIPRLRIENKKIVDQHSSALNTSFAYLVTSEIWSLLNFQQRHLTKKLFRMPGNELCSSKFFIRFPVQWDSPFTLSLAIFFMATQESGFSLKWHDLSIYQAKQFNFTKVIQKDAELWLPLSVQHFLFAIYLICFLWLMAILSFCIELFWFSAVKKFLNRKLKVLVLKKRRLERRRKYANFYKRGFEV